MFSDDLGRKGLSKKTKDNIFLSSHKTILYSALIGFALLFFALDAFAVDWYDSNWSYRKKITIDHTKVTNVTTPSTTYANLPVLVNLTGLTNVSDANGGDIRFTGSDGTTELPREIVSFSSGTLYAYVKITLTKDSGDSTDDVIYIYYGNSGASEPVADATYGSENAWNSGYTGVYHLTETVGNQHLDSTSNDYDSTGVSVTDQGIAGTPKIIGADKFNGSSNNVTGFPNSGSYYSGNEGTLEAWIYPTGSGVSSATFSEMERILTDDNGNHGIARGNWNGNGDGIWVSGIDLAEGDNTAKVQLSVNTSAYQYVVATFSTTDTKLTGYYNGAYVNEDDMDCISSPGWCTGIVRWGVGAPNYFNGYIDEVRYSNVVRSAEWIQTTYNNENAPTSGGFFSSVGSEISRTATVIWDGSLSTDWGTEDNWDIGEVPADTHTVSILNAANALTLDTTRTIAALTVNGETLTLNGNSLTVTGNLTISNSGIIDASAATPTITVGGDWDSSAGTFTYGSSTVTFNGTSGTSQLTPGSSAFNDLTIDDSGGSLTVQLQDDTEVAGNLTVTSGTLDYNNKTLTLSGTSKNFTISPSGIATGSGGTTNITGTITYTDDSTSGTQNIGALTVN